MGTKIFMKLRRFVNGNEIKYEEIRKKETYTPSLIVRIEGVNLRKLCFSEAPAFLDADHVSLRTQNLQKNEFTYGVCGKDPEGGVYFMTLTRVD
jgi:hypothetical protein